MPAPQVDDHAPADPHADRGTEFVARAEVFAEGVFDFREGGIAETRDRRIFGADRFVIRTMDHGWRLGCGRETLALDCGSS